MHYITAEEINIPGHTDVIGPGIVAASGISLFIIDTSWENSKAKYDEHTNIVQFSKKLSVCISLKISSEYFRAGTGLY